MKKALTTITVMALIAMGWIIGEATDAHAKDMVLDATVQSVTIKPDKNGNDYARLIIQEPRELNGIKYNADVMVMCFGTTVEKAQTFTKGDKFRAIASQNEYRGSTSYRVVQFIPTATAAE